MRRVHLQPLRWRRAPRGRAAVLVGDRGGGVFLPGVFPDARQYVEAAFGADLSASSSTWTWTELTGMHLVQWDPGVTAQVGYTGAVRRLTSGWMTFRLRNDQANGGDFVVGNALGRWWPYVRENTPIRARLDVGSGPSTVFFGYATSWNPTRDAAGKAMCDVLVNGYLRRLRQGQEPAFSAMRKAIDLCLPRAYWPMEQGVGATVGASAVDGIPDMRVTAGVVSFGAGGEDLPASLALATFTSGGVAGQLFARIPASSLLNLIGTLAWRVEFLIKCPALEVGDLISVVDWTTAGTVQRWSLRVAPVAAGGLSVTYVTSSGSTTHLSNHAIDDGAWHHVRIDARQNLNNINLNAYVDGTAVITQLLIALTNGDIDTMTVNYGLNDTVRFPALGHLAMWRQNTVFATSTVTAFSAYAGETVAARMARLASQSGVLLTVVGTADDLMGPQRPATFLDGLQDAIDVDGGALVDGIDAGLTYYTRQAAYSLAAALTLDSAQGDLPKTVNGEHSDRDRVNTFTARDPYTGADRTHEREDGDLGSDTVGAYTDSGDFRVDDPAQLSDLAAWRTGLGTVPGLRWSALRIQLAKPGTARLAQQWLESRLFTRVDALGLSTGSAPDRSLLLAGWQQHWNSRVWDVTQNVGPYDGYGVTTLGDTTNDPALYPYVGWLDVDTVTTAAALAAGDTSVVVNVTGTVLTNPTVSTYADDIDGLFVDIDGLKIGVTAITAPSGIQQTLTITGADVLRAIPADAAVTAWNPVLLGL